MTGPIGIFDAGLGAYGVVAAVRRAAPGADVVYLADRASFPYGAKTHGELVRVVSAGARELERRGCTTVVVASNAPSVTVLPDVSTQVRVPVVGVFPPVTAALAATPGTVAVLGAASMIGSPELRAYVAEHTGADAERVRVRSAGYLIDLVESAAFIDDAMTTQAAVDAFVARLRADVPDLGAMTLSSTHLPWLRPFVARACPDVILLDPADDVAAQVEPLVSRGDSLTCLVTERPGLAASDFAASLRRLTDAEGERPLEPVVLHPLS